MRRIAFIAALVMATATLGADEVVLDLSKDTSDNPPANYVEKGKTFDIVIKNRVPTRSYKVTGDRIIEAVKAPSPAVNEPCTKPRETLLSVLAGKDEKEVAKIVSDTPKACNDAQKKQFETVAAELTQQTLTFASVRPVTDKTDLGITVEREGKKWTLILQPAQTREEIAATKAAQARAAGLNTQLERTRNSSSLITRECTWEKGCDPEQPIFINGDHVSTVYFTGLPTDERLEVRVFAGEHSASCPALDSNFRRFSQTHDTVTVPLHMRSNALGFGQIAGRRRVEYALTLYGMLPVVLEAAEKNEAKAAATGGQSTPTATTIPNTNPDIDVRQKLCGTNAEALLSAVSDQDRLTVTRAGMREYPSVPLFLRGKSELVTVEFRSLTTNETKTFLVPVRYQRFWLDAGGFFAFSRREDEEVLKTALTGDDKDKVKVTDVRHLKDVTPSTGIVVNVHPGNFPYVAWQFGIAAQQDRLPSYYLGLGLRAREIGKRSLATVAFGIAAIQSNRFNGLHFTDDPKCGETKPCMVLAADSPLLTPTRKYAFEPYLSISLGFSFGGVSDKTDLTAAPGGGDR